MNRQWRMVRQFQSAFDLPVGVTPVALTEAQRRDRYWFHYEENQEFLVADTVVGQADAMLDLIYFALGTLVMLGVSPDRPFDIVHRANMTKLWPDGTVHRREEDGKVIKPPGWVGPEAEMAAEIERQASATAEPTNLLTDEEVAELYQLALWAMQRVPDTSEVDLTAATNHAAAQLRSVLFINVACSVALLIILLVSLAVY